MARTVREIMNRELFSVKPGDRVDDALAAVVALGVSGAPVADGARPVGFVSWRDLARAPADGATVATRMTAPAVTLRERDTIEQAAAALAETGLHHAPVVDDAGRMVGFVSLVDVVRGLVGRPAGHPPSFAHFDAETGVVWTDDLVLDDASIASVPDGPGVLVLVHGGRGVPETPVWAESTNSLRTRLYDLRSEPQPEPILAHWLRLDHLRFRAASIPDAETRRRLAAQLASAARRALWPERIG